MAEPDLVLEDVVAGYGGAAVLDGVSFSVPPGGSLALLGRNGAGKSTLVLTVMGFTGVQRGAVSWRGDQITYLAPYLRARRGLGWIPQAHGIFPTLTVDENLRAVARPGRWTAASVYCLFPRLAPLRDRRGLHLSGGERQILSLARTLVTNPGLLLLDEPSEGLAPHWVEELVNAIGVVTAQTGMALILVEHHTELALSLTRDALVLEEGKIAFHGTSAGLRTDPRRTETLLGLAR